jgi:SAM-dependent methyltransferase
LWYSLALFRTMSRTIARPPYSILARYYDRLVGDDARKMNRHARGKILGETLSRARTVCDLGCGTGSTAIELARAGKKVYAVDFSPDMCRLARQKARRARRSVKVLRADMRSFRLPEPVDLVLSEFNPLNHLPGRSDLVRAFRAVARNLQPCGWFCFDLNTCRSLKEQYTVPQWIEHRDFCLIIHGRFDSRRLKAHLDFDWFIPSGKTWRRYRGRMADTCWSNAEIRRALRWAGFRRIRNWDGADVRPPSPHLHRGYDAYYLARKPARP